MAQNYLYGINLGEAIQTGQALRKNNMLLDAAEKEQVIQPKVNRLREVAAGGDDQAFQWLLANDPKIGEFMQAVDRMDDISRKRTAERTEQIGGVIGGLYERIQSAPTTEERQALWSTFYKNAPVEVQKELGEQYNPTKLAVSVSRLLGMKHYADKALLGETAKRNMQKLEYENQFTAGENEKNRQNQLDAARLRGGGAVGEGVRPKAADESLIYRQAAGLFGGTFDQAGNLIALDAGARPKVQAISTEASRLFATGKYTHSQAVSIAAEKYGVSIGGSAKNSGAASTGKPIKPFM
jgi:hypothetical protein